MDYLGLCQIFNTFIVRNVPVMSLSSRNELKRFTTLIDTLYDQHSRLVILAEAPLDKLFDFSEQNMMTAGRGVVQMGDLNIETGDVSGRTISYFLRS